jgi:beta-N-acetylhexosaminidase
MQRVLALAAVLLLAACSAQAPTPAPTIGTSTGPTGTPSDTLGPSGSSFASIEPTPAPSIDATTNPTVGPTQAPTSAPTPPPTPKPTPTPSITPTPTLAQLVGQKLMVAMSGTTPSADLLARIKAGQVGGVILFGSNISNATQLAALTKKLQAAATQGGQPRLIISTDQEGGSVKRVPWIYPTLAPSQMTTTSTAQSQGLNTGKGLLGLGINNDLAPVADVPASTSVFMYQQGRTWSFSASTTASLSNAFATGLEQGGVLPTMKHFPGLGYAVKNTDQNVDKLTESISQLTPGLLPYKTAISRHIPMIMLSNAWYTAWDPNNAAGWSHAIGTTLLRGQLGFQGVTITDSLSGIASAMGVSATSLAVKACRAGTDMILVTGSEASTKATYNTLLADAESGVISRATLLASYQRILAMKAGL